MQKNNSDILLPFTPVRILWISSYQTVLFRLNRQPRMLFGHALLAIGTNNTTFTAFAIDLDCHALLNAIVNRDCDCWDWFLLRDCNCWDWDWTIFFYSARDREKRDCQYSTLKSLSVELNMSGSSWLLRPRILHVSRECRPRQGKQRLRKTTEEKNVSKMLVGGLHVVGIYVWAAESAFKNSTLVLWQAVKAIARAAPVFVNGEADERILVHISYSPRRWSCRSCNLDSNFTSMSFRPCDLKMAKLLSTLQTFRSTFSFELRLPLFQEDIQKTNHMKKILLKAIGLLAEQLKSAKAVLDGTLVTKDKLSIPGGPHEIELLLPFADVKSLQAGSSEEVVGLVVFSGTIFAQAYTFPREPLLQAVEDLKGDIVTSLKSRLEILSDEVEEASASLNSVEVNDHEDSSLLKQGDTLFSCNWSEACSFVFPRRVLVPWLDGVFICDYLQARETFQDLQEHCEELMSMKSPLEQSEIFEPEVSGPASIGTSFWGTVVRNSISSSSTQEKDIFGQPGKESITNLSKSRVVTFGSLHGAVALVIVTLAILIALTLMAVGRRTSN